MLRLKSLPMQHVVLIELGLPEIRYNQHQVKVSPFRSSDLEMIR